MSARHQHWLDSRRYVTPLGVVLLYLLVGVMWVVLSERVMAAASATLDRNTLALALSANRLAFIVLSGGLLYFLMRYATAALKRSERVYREMFESTTVAILVDPDTLRIVDANQAAVEFYRWSRDELVGRSLADVNTLPLDELRVRMAEVRRHPHNRLEFRHRTASGDVRDVEIFASEIEVGGRTLVYSIIFDLTPRVAAERALEASEQRYRTLISEAADGFLISDPDGALVDTNARASEITGYAADELRGMQVTELIPPGEPEGLPRAAGPAQIPALQERRLRRKDGSVAHVEISAKRLEDGGEQAIVRDVGERRRLEDQLRQAQKMEAVGQLAGGLAHDLNNVLAIVLATSELVRQGIAADRADLHTELHDLQIAAQRGAAMIRKLLGFSRNAPFELVTLDLAATISESVSTLRHLLPSTIEIEADLSEPVMIRADAGAIEQILLNVATNARDAMPEGGRLAIQVCRRRPQGSAERRRLGCLIIRDTGIGMDDATRARIFEPFFTTKPAPQGSGLGMTMIYGLVQQQGGRVSVESAPGQGTTITICFRQSLGPPAPVLAPPPTEWPRGTETILLVEDEAGLRRSARVILERVGYQVIVAADGEEAAGIMRQRMHDVSLVISDIIMPRMTGKALYQALRESGYSRKFLYSSGFDGNAGGTAEHGDEPQTIRKPWTAAEFVVKVRETLDA